MSMGALWLLVIVGIFVFVLVLRAENKNPVPTTQKQPASTHLSGLVFKSADAFFEYQCRYGITDIVQHRPVVGQVISDVTDIDLGAGRRIERPAGVYLIRLASQDDPKQTFASCVTDGPPLRDGDLVAWMPLTYLAALKKWNGVIFATLAPEIGPEGLVVLRDFRHLLP